MNKGIFYLMINKYFKNTMKHGIKFKIYLGKI